MAITKVIDIDGKPVTFKASAAIPRMYRIKYGRDIFQDLEKLDKSGELDTLSLGIFEDLAYLMARHADPSIPDTLEEWLDQFNVLSIYQALPEILNLWGMNVQTQSRSKKNAPVPKGK